MTDKISTLEEAIDVTTAQVSQSTKEIDVLLTKKREFEAKEQEAAKLAKSRKIDTLYDEYNFF